MKRFAYLAAAIALWATHASAQGLGATRSCERSTFVNISTATTTQLVPVANDRNAGATIYLCGFSMTVGAADTVKLIYGTQTSTPCDTNAVTISGTLNFTAAGSFVMDSPIFNGMAIPAGNQLCAVTTTTGAVALQVLFDEEPL